MHVTLRARAGLPSFRDALVFGAMRHALRAASRDGFRVVHFSVQNDHVHLVAEADTMHAWQAGVRGLTIRLARSVNRVLSRRGSVWADRYHARILRTPREVRNAIVYVLQNWRKHLGDVVGLDACSSARWFSGWRIAPGASSGSSPPTAEPRTWLARVGWRRHGLIGADEMPQRRRFTR